MNTFDEKYEIRLACYDEIAEIMTFIDTYWRKNHLMARNRSLFEYEFVVDGRVNVVIAKERTSGAIHGIQGFLQASKDSSQLDAWGSIWKVIPGASGLLGIEIVKRLHSLVGIRSFLLIGANPKTAVPIYKRIMRYQDTGKMQHYYCLAKRDKYHICQAAHYEPCESSTDCRTEVIPLKNMDELRQTYNFSYSAEAYPYKDEWYINHRYFAHPIYSYQIYGLRQNGETQALLICREQAYGEAKALRVVDYIGKKSLFAGLNRFWQEKLHTYEYVDMYAYGFEESYIQASGMIKVRDNDTNIIPNYFTPYVAENIDIWVCSPNGKAVFFKADGDQDRPN